MEPGWKEEKVIMGQEVYGEINLDFLTHNKILASEKLAIDETTTYKEFLTQSNIKYLFYYATSRQHLGTLYFLFVFVIYSYFLFILWIKI